MSSQNAIRLLIVEDTPNDGEVYSAALKGKGQAVRAHYLTKEHNVEDVIDKHEPDIIIIRYNNKVLSFRDLKNTLKSKKKSPPLIVTARDGELNVVKALEAGARDMVINTNLDHLTQVVMREVRTAKVMKRVDFLEVAYRDAEERCQVLMESSRDAVCYIHEGMFVHANQSYLEMFGYTSFDDLEGMPILDMVAQKSQEDFKQFIRGLSNMVGEHQFLNTRVKNTLNEEFNVKMESSEASIDGEACVQIIIRRQTDSKALEEQINKLSLLDPMTSLLNRSAFLSQMTGKLDEIEDGQHYALYNLVIDGFSKMQETLGLVGGDQVLKKVAECIQEHLNDEIACRYEGSRYYVLVKHQDPDQTQARAQQLIQQISNSTFDINEQSIGLSISIGISFADDESLDVNELVSRANQALKESIKQGGKKAVAYIPKEGEMTQKQKDASWVRKVDNALNNDGFNLLFQPIIQLDSADTERYEVTIEMVDGEQRISPNLFLPAAERMRKSQDIDRWVVEQSLTQLTERVKTHPNTVFFVKLSASSLADSELFRRISDAIKSMGIPNGSLVFEVKEEAVLSHLKHAQAFSTLLKTIHCGFAIDDFGKGPDPFKLVEHIPAQFLKFHKDFALELASNPENQSLLKQITDKATELNKSTIVQFVEDASTLSILWTIGATLIQGNFFQDQSQSMDYDFSSGLG